MNTSIELILLPEEATDEHKIRQKAAEFLSLEPNEISFIKKIKKSVDARNPQIRIHLQIEVFYHEAIPEIPAASIEYPYVKNNPSVLIAGSGPAGMFAALRLIELGFKPILIERGKDVRSRRRDLAIINREHTVNPDSNYCFGEGGAGTYSDGKLYTRSTKRGNVAKILNTFRAHGAGEEILYDAHPHIGTNKLPAIVAAMRESILRSGGEIHFNKRIVSIQLKNNAFKSVTTHDGDCIEAENIILATGHSADDIFEMLYHMDEKNVLIEAKPFALGVRIEHQQSLIDSIQYHCRNPKEVALKRLHLPASSYNLTTQVDKRGVYSFCMCPGGFIVAAATRAGEVVLNGMSPSKRDSRYSNSGIVVSVEKEDLKKYEAHGPLAALRFRQDVEKTAWISGGKNLSAPAQRMIDFVKGVYSSSLPETSYVPGAHSTQLSEVLPGFIHKRLQIAFQDFGKKMKGYYTNEALLLGVESRTSSPVKIPRDKESLQHTRIKGLYPCGEGAGYAGGIVSAAIDGERCAEMIAASS